MPKPTMTLLRRIDGSWLIELPHDIVRSLGWTDTQSIFLHRELSGGLWLSAQDESATLTELVAVTEQINDS